MADLTSAAAPEVQERARAMGWIPPEEFKGDPERFTDADVFIERGETVLPIVKKNLETTRGELAALKETSAKQAAALAKLEVESREAGVRNAAEKQRAVDDAIKATKAALGKASEAGDHEAVAELTGDLIELDGDKKAAAAAAKAIEDAKTTKSADTSGADKAAADVALVQEWIADGNDWFKTSPRKQALMQGIAVELRQSGNTQTGKAFMNACKAEMLKTLGETQEPVDKVEGGRNGSGDESGARGSAKKSYNNLPADAKKQCDADARQFVGPDKSYKDIAAWRSRYAEIYFKDES